MGTSAASLPPDHYAGIDDAAQADGYTRALPGGLREAWIAVDGMVCAACGHTIEAALRAVPGVRSARVALMTQRARVVWEASAAAPSDLFRAIARVGYAPFPAGSAEFEAARRQASRLLLWRLLVAACAMMQVMMYAWPEYIMGPGVIEPDLVILLRWAQWMMTVPVMLFCAWPILGNALRSLRSGRISMDLPAAIGIVLAFGASSAATFDGVGEVWFDSVTMFVFFLLLARWLEASARHRATLRLEALNRLLPATVARVTQDAQMPPGTGRVEYVAPARLLAGDLVRVAPGEAFAADGRLVEGDTHVNEALLTGESLPLPKRCGAVVRAGSINVLATVLMRVECPASDSTLGNIRRLVDEAASARPDWMRTADRWATVFLIGVMVLAAAAWAGWQFVDPTRALAVAISVLIVTCPCALSLATPSAMLAATAGLARRGIWLRVPGALERLAAVEYVAFDKTGTLTDGVPALDIITPLRAGTDPIQARMIGAALAAWSRHPLSRALAAAVPEPDAAGSVRETAGGGLEGSVAGRPYRLGSLTFVQAGVTDGGYATPPDAVTDLPSAWLADAQGLIARFTFGDSLRLDAGPAVEALQAGGLRVALLSGDAPASVARVAARLRVDDACGGMTPEEKLARVRGWQQHGKTVAMVGDGINDGPALAGADVSIALGDAAPLAHSSADLILASGRLYDLPLVRHTARRAVRIMRQNLLWAFSWNAVSVPLALLGYMPPWAAGLGMALSSLLVIGNGLRLLNPPSHVALAERPIPPAAALRSAAATR